MIVHTNNTIYRVNWHHDHAARMTVCNILDVPNSKLYSGTALVHPDDNYDKNRGRKVSLSRALSSLFPYKYDRLEDGNNYRHHREFWTEYNKMRGNKW